MQTYDFAGIPVRSTSSADLTRHLLTGLDTGRRQALLFANANFVVQCQPMREWLGGDEVLVVNDGVAMDLVGKLIHRQGFVENLNGTDYCPRLLAALPPGTPVFLLGGRPGVAARAAEVLARDAAVAVAGHADGFTELQADDLIARINDSGAQVLLVALGNPRQETWIMEHFEALRPPLVVGVGALFDFLSGTVQRAPVWVRTMRAEWLFRLMLEPRRLLKRYTVDIVRFVWYCRAATGTSR